jgi:hypothetical protein
MARRKLSVWEQALKDASRELGEPKGSFVVERYATLATLLKLQRSQWAQGKSSNASDVIATLAELEAMRHQRGKDALTDIRIHVTETIRGTCPACGVTSDVPVEMVDEARADALATHSAPPQAIPAGTSVPALPNSSGAASSGEPMPSQHIEGKSPSTFNSQRGTPLKRLQPSPYVTRTPSPMSH